MKIKKLFLIILCILSVSFALGATGILHLTHSSEDVEQASGELIGVLITSESLNLFDDEAFVSDHQKELTVGENAVSSNVYQKKLYAKVVDRKLEGMEDESLQKAKDYIFEGVDGIRFFVPQKDGKGFYQGQTDERLADIVTKVDIKDGTTSTSSEATVFVLPDKAMHSFYFNPIYRSSDGEVYVMEGQLLGSSGDGIGSSFTYTMNESALKNIQNSTVQTGSEIMIHIKIVNKPLKINVLEFDQDGKLLLNTSFMPSTFPENFQMQQNTAYIVTETTSESKEKGMLTERALLQPEEKREDEEAEDGEGFSFLICGEDGICTKKICRLGKK